MKVKDVCGINKWPLEGEAVIKGAFCKGIPFLVEEEEEEVKLNMQPKQGFTMKLLINPNKFLNRRRGRRRKDKTNNYLLLVV